MLRGVIQGRIPEGRSGIGLFITLTVLALSAANLYVELLSDVNGQIRKRGPLRVGCRIAIIKERPGTAKVTGSTAV